MDDRAARDLAGGSSAAALTATTAFAGAAALTSASSATAATSTTSTAAASTASTATAVCGNRASSSRDSHDVNCMTTGAISRTLIADFSGRLVHPQRPVIVIYGQRAYGAVDEQAGQYAVTKFAHIYYMPLVPVGSVWLTKPDRGIPTPLNGKSVLSAYARTWGLLAGTLMLVAGLSGAILTAVLGVVILGASIATWKLWGKRTSEDAKLRGNLNALAFGTYCPPELLSGPIRQHYTLELQRRQQITPNARPPEDVARFGTRDLGELVRTYGILSLHGTSQAREQLSELLRLKAPSAELADGIYRDKNTAGDDPGAGDGFQLPAERAAMLAVIDDAARQRMLRA